MADKDYYTKEEVNNMFHNKQYINEHLDLKNNVLLSGNTNQNIKTICGEDVLGVGDITLDFMTTEEVKKYVQEEIVKIKLNEV